MTTKESLLNQPSNHCQEADVMEKSVTKFKSGISPQKKHYTLMVCHDTAPGTKSEGMWHAILFVLARTVGILKVRNLRHERTPKAYLTQSNRPQ